MKAKTMCLCSYLVSPFPSEKASSTHGKCPCEKHQSLKDYITHLSLHLQPTLTGCGRAVGVERPLLPQGLISISAKLQVVVDSPRLHFSFFN